MAVQDQLPGSIRTNLQSEPLFSAKTDLLTNGHFGEQWLTVTEQGVALWDTESKALLSLAINELTDARVSSGVGGGTLMLDTKKGPVVAARYTASLSTVFGFAAKLIGVLAKGEERPVVSEKEFPRYCPKCDNPLSEGTQVCPVCKNNGKVILRMLGYAKPYKLQMAAAGFLLVITTLVELIPPYLTKIMIDDVLQPKDKGSMLLMVVLGLGLTSLLMAGMQTVRGLIGVWVGSKLMGDLRKDIYSSLKRLSLAFFDRRQTSQFIGRVNSDSEAMRQFMTDGVIWVSGESLRVLAIFVIRVMSALIK